MESTAPGNGGEFPGGFTEWMRERSEPDFGAVVAHPFTEALFEGKVPRDRMRGYLVQDYQFVDLLLALLGAGLARADRHTSRLRIAGSVAVVTGIENDYFRRSFDELEVPRHEREAPELDETTVAFRDLLGDTTERGGYADVLTVLTVAEWSYLEWASPGPERLPEDFVQAEWITLHNGAEFADWVSWLRSELDRVAEELDERERARCLRLFQLATRYERDFFDAHWR
ncbi:thiaminase/transcriptional activator TenA [Actinopolyspora lacussalsi]|nr:thiaminase/transcriptional activator TenA [Actinopolyspora lacussalsi]